jgi:hypothetical protein
MINHQFIRPFFVCCFCSESAAKTRGSVEQRPTLHHLLNDGIGVTLQRHYGKEMVVMAALGALDRDRPAPAPTHQARRPDQQRTRNQFDRDVAHRPPVRLLATAEMMRGGH